MSSCSNKKVHCRFLQNGLAISYDHVAKPCCVWKLAPDFVRHNRLPQVDLASWHSNPDLKIKQQQLANGIWPDECARCRQIESSGRGDSMRLNANHSYAHYQESDLTLEIRPGSTCNFACQTCWPEASSRVAQYQQQAGMIQISELDSKRIDNFDWLEPIASRIKDVVLLGGEPFYDKNCQRFLDWSVRHLAANMMMFTNGSGVDYDFIDRYQGRLTLIFSIDAIGRPAEYVRFGTEWHTVIDNFRLCRTLEDLEIRVNITTSIFNFAYLEQLLCWLADDWPDCVTFGVPSKQIFSAAAIPLGQRSVLSQSLHRLLERLESAMIEKDQKTNAINAVRHIISDLDCMPFDHEINQAFGKYVRAMDAVKKINISEYCPEVAAYI